MPPLYFFQFFLFSLCVHIFTLFTYVAYYSDKLSSSCFSDFGKEYDYIIVGAGTAGSVIAHRLSTETNYTFIVLEAGGSSHPLYEIPVVGPFLQRSLYDWQYETVSQEGACLAMVDRKCRLPRGKIIGGSSKLNNMIHVRGNITHYSHWFHGKYSETYIKKQFTFIENELLYLNGIKYQSDLSKSILQAVNELGFENIKSEFKIGFSESTLSQRAGKRWSTSDNLKTTKKILTHALVEKILFNGNTAVGVNVDILGKSQQIYAKKGVILTAGAFNTPKILQLSGIGPEKLLKSLNIPLVKNLPVGRNLQDHVATGVDLVLFNNSVSIESFDMINPFNLYKYFFEGVGPLTTPGCEVLGFVSTKDREIPDLQYLVLPVGLASDRGSLLKNSINIKNDVWENYFIKSFDKSVATILPVVLHPHSKGFVFINSTDPKVPPIIDPKYLSDGEDIEILINGLLLSKKIIETEAMRKLGAYLNPNKFPGCEHLDFFSNLYLECYVKHLTLASYHPIGTCSMGLPHSKNTVVDASFKILGVERLFVADASVMPTLPSGNINAAVAMMASIFFDANIGTKFGKIVAPVCFKLDLLFEYIYKICIINS
ncbi:hypothetical protein K1T71_006992 [Dendrolimus kikuchii]|uniref:Uncharacterized protein n=1 Tax=Dendrolimus kikuchii TaxID=765133 RepID=A0ACC1D086_9NEOP|nr:hypothetical protein K1T71_006992 [Dendrolimus kikuchii]